MENGEKEAFATSIDGYVQHGLTKREYFDGLAMQGLLCNNLWNEAEDQEILCSMALSFTDELLKQLGKSE
jgi:hypothetical protein